MILTNYLLMLKREGRRFNMVMKSRLLFPAIRALMGDWVYYVATMKMADIAERVGYAKELHKSDKLKEMLQRTLDESKHAAGISRYLIREKQRLFNAMVIGLYGGDPEWHEIKIKSANKEIET